MHYIKVYHQDGLIYFDNLRVANLILSKTGSSNEWLVTIDIQSYDYTHTDSEVEKLARKFNTRINNDFDYVWVTFEQVCSLNSVEEVKSLTLSAEDSEDKFLYFGWHIPLYHNKVKFTGNGSGVDVFWTATSDDVNYYDERAKVGIVEINCNLNLLVFHSEKELQDHEGVGSERTEIYFSILRIVSGQAIEGQDTIELDWMLDKNLTMQEQNELAWKSAVSLVPEQ